jgi:hypothetical protein
LARLKRPYPNGKDSVIMLLRRTAILFGISLLLLACGNVPPEAKPAAESWLALVDAGRYPESWNEAAEYFKGAIGSDAWVKSLNAVRTPLGEMKTRTVKGAKSAKSLPGAPDGEYVVFQFDTSFAQKGSAVETVTMSHEKDGAWRTSGYFIK